MIIIGVDYHPSFQQIAFLDQETGECGGRRLNHSDGEAEKFYRDLRLRGISVRVGMEATGYSRWFERLLAELGIELWIGDAAEIKTKRVRKQKTDRQERIVAAWVWPCPGRRSGDHRRGDVGRCGTAACAPLGCRDGACSTWPAVPVPPSSPALGRNARQHGRPHIVVISCWDRSRSRPDGGAGVSRNDGPFLSPGPFGRQCCRGCVFGHRCSCSLVSDSHGLDCLLGVREVGCKLLGEGLD